MKEEDRVWWVAFVLSVVDASHQLNVSQDNQTMSYCVMKSGQRFKFT